VIYEAQGPAIDRPGAIKLVRADLHDGGEREEYLARFGREAQAVGRCTHANIVALYDYAMQESNPFLAMEYVEGVSLAQALERGTRFRPDGAAFIMTQGSPTPSTASTATWARAWRRGSGTPTRGRRTATPPATPRRPISPPPRCRRATPTSWTSSTSTSSITNVIRVTHR